MCEKRERNEVGFVMALSQHDQQSKGRGRPQGSPPLIHATPAPTMTKETRATARVSTPHPLHTRPYNDYGNGSPGCLLESLGYQLGQVQDAQLLSLGVYAAAQVHEAAGIVGDNDGRACAFGVAKFVVEQAFRHVAVLDGGRAAEAAAYIGLRHLAKFQSKRVLDDVTSLFAQAETVARLAGVVVGGDDFRAAILLAHGKLCAISQQALQKTGEVYHFVREFPGALQPALLIEVFKELDVILHDGGDATGGGAEDVAGVIVFKSLLEHDDGLARHGGSVAPDHHHA